MISAERLFIWADKLGIKVVFRNLRKQHPDLLGMADASIRVATLDSSLRFDWRQQKCILAEEIGHILFPPRSGHVRYHSKSFIYSDCIDRSLTKIIVAQDERKALQWATSVLMPDVEFWGAVKDGANTVYQLAEWFNVEEWFVLLKIGFIRRQAREEGQRLKWRDIISREPSECMPEKGF